MVLVACCDLDHGVAAAHREFPGAADFALEPGCPLPPRRTQTAGGNMTALRRDSGRVGQAARPEAVSRFISPAPLPAPATA